MRGSSNITPLRFGEGQGGGVMKNILVIDDSPVVRNFHINILKAAGFRADGACDGSEALEKALNTTYHLILCDINMPIMDGLTFIQRYREHNEDIPIIIMTTQEEEVHRKKGYESGANLYFVKPIRPAKLILHIRILIGEVP